MLRYKLPIKRKRTGQKMQIYDVHIYIYIYIYIYNIYIYIYIYIYIVINCCFSSGEMLGTIVMLELSLDQQQEAGLLLRAQRRPAPPWFILLLLLLLQMVEYSEIDGADSIIIKVSLAEFVNVIDYSPATGSGHSGNGTSCLLWGRVVGIEVEVQVFVSLVLHTAQQGGGAPGMSPGHSSRGPQRGSPI